ncbi:proteasome inhibitor PI31 subunit [Galendromus occidentalis]|uniref:Proteasome inhibitor PI31 subunit n=1 Tax=Galendromus occidentalis TaxID=34638 RepID=A0AAJ6VZV3_9ACAR|nr:proteasome inhibitor PI31 subunit [Galendromus occidentalis]
MTPADFGLESLYRLQPITTKEDALIILVHFVLSKNGWQYVGRGNNWSTDETPSESLPQGWNSTGDPFRYVSRSDPPKKFTIKFVVHDKFLLVNMVSLNEETTVSMNINMSSEVEGNELASNVPKKVYPNLLTLINNIYDQLIRPCEVSSRSVGTSTKESGGEDPARREPREPGYYVPEPRYGLPGGIPHAPEPGIHPLGRRDLDPFAGHGQGGGMIVDPLRIDRSRQPLGPLGPDGVPLPRGAVPPGARFDPFGPGGAGPDPDHLPRAFDRGGRGGGNFGGFGGGAFGPFL